MLLVVARASAFSVGFGRRLVGQAIQPAAALSGGFFVPSEIPNGAKQ
jgi:hypothetical protein